jgi:hypothetical protein
MTIRHLFFCTVVFYWLFPNDLSAQNYTVLNDASVYSGCNCYRLTPDQNNKGGGVYQNNAINLNNSFDYTFNVFLGCNANGADGIVFILTDNITGIGSRGGGLGYGGLSGNSLAIEYDTYQNTSNGDPPYDHIAMESGGSVSHNVAGPVQASASQTNIKDCAYHTTEIIWNVNTQTYTVYFDGSLRLTYTGNIVNTFFGGNPIVNWGWSGSTGGATDDQRFCITTVSSWTAGTNYQSCNNTIQFHDVSTSNVGSIHGWAWDFGEMASGTSDTSSRQNPTHTYASSGTYTVTLTITDMTGCTTTYSHAVTINPPITFTPTIVQPLCNGGNNGSVTLGISGGFGTAAGYGGYYYLWSNGATSNSDVGLTAGTYNITVTDSVCTTTASYTLNQPSPITASTSHTDASCGANNGSVTISISGGTPPYTGVSWNSVPGYTLTGLPAGLYIADFHDANGCSAALTYRETINSLPCGYNVSTASTDVTCYGGTNGTATLTVTGGVNPITISWTNSAGTVVSTAANATGLPADTYTYNYSDGSGQTFTGTVVVHQPGAALIASLTNTGTTCSYLNNGSAVASVTANGSPPYSYAWSVAQPNSATATGLSPGAISVSITDNNGCTATAGGTVAGQTILSPSISVINDSCYLAHKGSATVTVTGGMPVYSYIWSNNAIGSTNYSIGAGTYTVTVTDHNSCTATASGLVGQPPLLTEIMTHVNIACYGGNTGSATITPSGGNGGFAYSWSNSAVTATTSPLATGTYYVTVTDSKNCMVSDSATITQPAAAFTVAVTQVNVKCKGSATGSITLTESGGTTPYGTVTWSDAGTGTTRTGLVAGSYSYTATDANSCSATGTINITQPAATFTIAQAHTDVPCYGNNTGTITLTPSGGTTPYATPQWLDLAAGFTRSNLAAGTYYYADSDANGCLFIDSVKIIQPASAFTVTEVQVNVLCKGDATGSITLTESGGTTPYGNVNWSGGATGTTRTNLVAGSYTYTATDGNGCLATGTVTITEPAFSFTVAVTQVNVKCKGSATGSITLTEAGGTTPYGTVTWSDSGTGTTRTGLVAGSYSYTATDANSCSATGTISITEPAAVFTISQAHTDVLCYGNNTGTITLTPSGGTTPYATPQWLDLATGFTRSNLVAGTYYYADSDANGCLFIDSVKIIQPTAMTVNVTETDATCSYNTDGTATATASGGVSPYDYSWSNSFSETNVATSAATGLSANSYTVTVTDQNACTIVGTTTVNAPPAITAQLAITNVICYGGNTGAVNVTAGGGASGFHYAWSPNAATGDQPVASGLVADTYSLTITDANSCTLDTFATVTQPLSALSYTTPVFVRNASCNGGANGEIKYVATGGTGPYSFTWDGSAAGSDDSAINLAAGMYDVTITDANSCTVANTVTVTQPTALTISSQSQTNEPCHGGNTGTATINIIGGTPGSGYTYTWNPNAGNTNTVSSLIAGSYAVTVTDSNQCTIIGNFTITEPPQLTLSFTKSDALCHGGSTGSIAITSTGGTPGANGYGYTWNPGVSTNNTASSLAAGTYGITVTDSLLCTATVSITVSEPQPLTPLIVSTTDVSCPGDSNGQVQLSATGGTSPYQYALSPDGVDYISSSSGLFTGLKMGAYTDSVTDANGCSNTIAVTIIAPNPIIASSAIDTVKCYGESNGAIIISATGGTPGYTFAFSNGVTNTTGVDSPLVAGSFSLTITDAKGCAISDTVILSQPDSLEINVTPIDPTVDLTESIDLQASSNNTNTVFTWSPATGLSNTTGSNTTATTYNTITYTLT